MKIVPKTAPAIAPPTAANEAFQPAPALRAPARPAQNSASSPSKASTAAAASVQIEKIPCSACHQANPAVVSTISQLPGR